MLDNWCYRHTHTLRLCNTYCFSTATMVTRTCLNVALYVMAILFSHPLMLTVSSLYIACLIHIICWRIGQFFLLVLVPAVAARTGTSGRLIVCETMYWNHLGHEPISYPTSLYSRGTAPDTHWTEAGWALEPVWTIWRREISWSYRELNSRSSSL
jgi:hypothetical protein